MRFSLTTHISVLATRHTKVEAFGMFGRYGVCLPSGHLAFGTCNLTLVMS